MSFPFLIIISCNLPTEFQPFPEHGHRTWVMSIMTVAKIETPADVVDICEAALVRRAKSGDMSAFEALYRRYVPRVFGLCLRMVGDSGLAEEITQDVFVRVWEKLHLFRGDSSLAPWLLAVTANVVKRHWRLSRRKTDIECSMESLEKARGSVRPEIGEPLGNVDLEKAIGQLPEKARKVLVLHDIEGYQHSEIAGMMGITIGTTKAQLHRARRMLREALSL